MPAYRSSAEAEIRVAVVERLRQLRPGCRIIHEINASSFGNRIDVLAVGQSDLIAVEIKSEKDKLDRLPDQIAAMKDVSNLVVAALHEKFLKVIRENVYPPDEARDATIWVYPKKERAGFVECSSDWVEWGRWRKPKRCLPHGALGLLWAGELQRVCKVLNAPGASKMTMEQSMDYLRWRLTGEQLASVVCAALLRRECPEADPPITAHLLAA